MGSHAGGRGGGASTATRDTAAAELYRKGVIEAFKAYDLAASEDDLRAPFSAPLRIALPQGHQSLLGSFNIEFQQNTALRDLLANDQSASDAFKELEYELEIATVADPPPAIYLLGVPKPEQDDPRYDAVVISQFDEQYLDQDRWQRHRDQIMKDAADWRLLAQITFAGWHQSNSEGTIYFLIRNEDLTTRRFDRAIVVYQQT